MWKLIAAAAAGVAVLAACKEPLLPPSTIGTCTSEGWPSVIAEVRDTSARRAAHGATMIIRDGAFADTAGPVSVDGLVLGAGNRRAGTYTVTISKPYYRDAVITSVNVPAGECGALRPVTVYATLALQPGAPPVRSVTVLSSGTIGLGLPNLTVPLRVHVDAAAGVDTAVAWTSSDTTIATVSPSGVVTSRCVRAAGGTWITATSVADPSKRGRVGVWVYPPTSGRC